MWPHFAIRGATGFERQIGQDDACDPADARICSTLFHSRGTSASIACARYSPEGLTINR
jgi:hypothetical protein